MNTDSIWEKLDKAFKEADDAFKLFDKAFEHAMKNMPILDPTTKTIKLTGGWKLFKVLIKAAFCALFTGKCEITIKQKKC